MPQYDFSDRVAVVTGGSGGIGSSHAQSFARAGADVAIWDVAVEAMEEVAGDVEAHGVDCATIECDVTDEASVREATKTTIDNLGQIDILANTAGISNAVEELAELDEELWDPMMDINLKGTWLCSKHVAQSMIDAGQDGAIVNTASTFAHVACPGLGHYSASKFGVWGLTQAMSAELAKHDINVNAVSPTGVKTPMSEKAIERAEDSDLDMIGFTGFWNTFDPPGTRIEPQDVTEAVLWLSSDAAKCVSGVALPVNAGMLL